MAGNKALNRATRAKQDEFYTQLSDIEKEMRYYKDFFAGKTVLCNCDDPYESNFFKYFALNFNQLHLKKLISTCYAKSKFVGEEFGYYVGAGGQLSFLPSENSVPADQAHRPYKVEITEVQDNNGDGRIDLSDVEYLMRDNRNAMSLLKGDGDFRSEECLDLLKQADVVVTNPPFSLFREYVAMLMKYEKKFLIIGNQNNVTYKDMFHLLMENRMWLGVTAPKEFIIPTEMNDRKNTYVREDGTIIAKFGNACWFTNLDLKRRHEDMILYKHYTPDKYPKYDNYDAINVGKITDIPCDYAGIMGVPVSFLNCYNPDQFEVLDMGHRGAGSYKYRTKVYTIKDAKNYSDLNATTVYIDANGKYKNTYFRVLIRNKHPEQSKEG